MIGSYRKKPVAVQAVQFTDDESGCEIGRWIADCGGNAVVTRGRLAEGRAVEPPQVMIETLEGTMLANIGDWIIRGVRGEFYPCKPGIFDATYEPLFGDEIVRISDAVRRATENPGHMVSVDEPWKGFPLQSDEVQR